MLVPRSPQPTLLQFLVVFRLLHFGAIFATVLTAIGSLIAQALTIGLLVAFYRSFERSELLVADLFPVLLATALCAGPLFWLFEKIDGIGPRVQEEETTILRQ